MVARRVPAFLVPVPNGALFAPYCPQVTTPSTHLLPAKKEAERAFAVPAPFMLACAGCSGCVFIALQHPQPCLGVGFSAACLLPAYFRALALAFITI